MFKARPIVIGCMAALLSFFVLGFIVFAGTIVKPVDAEVAGADAIVVLTGGDQRIREGGKLLKQGRGARMLISGVNRRTTRADLLRLSGLRGSQFDCCVDVGYRALDTVGNADEARTWARQRGYRKLIVVTSSYHMPRSLAELALELPDIELVPRPVQPKSFRTEAWWLDTRTTRVLIGEYLKYLPAAARLTVARVTRPFRGSDYVEAPVAARADI